MVKAIGVSLSCLVGGAVRESYSMSPLRAKKREIF